MPTRDLTSYFNTTQNKANTVNERINRLETNDSLSPVYLEDTIHASRARKGVSAPTEALRAVGGGGTVLMTVEQFSNAVQQDIYFEWHAPYHLDDATPVEFHLMWLPGAAWSAGNYMWKLEYVILSEGDAYNVGVAQTIQADVTPANAVDRIETEFTTTFILTKNQVIYCHLYRDVALDNGDSTGDVDFVEFKYLSRKRGSKT